MFAGPTDDPDRFELLTGLQGGEGITWRGHYRGDLDHPVTYAIKQLLPPEDAPITWPEAEDVRRWRDQRFLLQGLQNEHLVAVTDVFLGPQPHRLGTFPPGTGHVEYRVPYIVMEWVHGPTLTTIAQDPAEPVNPVQRLGWIRDLAEAIEALHSQTRTSGNPMLHRDIKPDNVIIHPIRGAVLVDLGTLRRLADGHDPRGMHSRHYTAPEVLRDLQAPRTAASDYYSLGAVAFFCITGGHPPAADERNALETIQAELCATASRLKIEDAGTFVTRLVAMLNPDQAARPSRAVSWAEDLLQAVRPRTIGPSKTLPTRRAHGARLPRSWRGTVTAVLALVLVAVLGFSLLVMMRREPTTQDAGAPLLADLEQVEPLLLDTPPFDPQPPSGISAGDLTVVSSEPNQITDDEAWLQANELSLPGGWPLLEAWPEREVGVPEVYRGEFWVETIQLAEGMFVLYGSRYSPSLLVAVDPVSKRVRYAYDFARYERAPGFIERLDNKYDQGIQFLRQVDNVLYVSHTSSSSAAEVGSVSAYITAIDLTSGRLIWRSPPLIANAINFEVVGDSIYTGYGMTDESDWLYALDRGTGTVTEALPLDTAPDLIILKDGLLFVRCYDTNYVIRP